MDILVVDDDLVTRKMLRFILESQAGHRVHEAGTPEEAEARVRTDHFDLILLDIIMPGLDGLELCKRVRTTSSVPIMIVSAHGDIPARVRGLQLGADDFLPKPFDPSELAARVDAVLRRVYRTPRTSADGLMRVGLFTLNLGEHSIQVRRGPSKTDTVQLTPTEFKLMLVLARSPGTAVSRDDLQAALWGPGSASQSGYHTLNAYISGLRERLEVNPGEPRHIVTVRNVGYRLDA